MNRELPILFSTDMVKALIEGRKTQTRRIMKPQPDFVPLGWVSTHTYEKKCRIQPGDVLYVRETWREYYYVDEHGYTNFDKRLVEFAADDPPMIREVDGDGWGVFNKDGTEKFIPWRPSIHMPKEAARIWLKVTDIRVERLQDISEADAVAEGVNLSKVSGDWEHTPVQEYEKLWKRINGPESWEANQWVWVISFEVLSTTGKPKDFTQLKTLTNA